MGAGGRTKGWRVLMFNGVDAVDYEGVTLAGDVNGDGEVDAKDVVDLINYLRGTLAGDKSQFDVNGDGKVNAADVVSLVNILTT